MSAEYRDRSLQFGCPDPLSKEASSRTTRYRILKKRKLLVEKSDNSAVATGVGTVGLTDSSADEIPPSVSSEDLPTSDVFTSTFDEGSDCDQDEYAGGVMCLSTDDPLLEFRSWDMTVEPADYSVAQTSSRDEIHGEEDSDLLDEQSDDVSTESISPLSLLLKQYSMRHGLTHEALSDLLLIFRHYLPDRTLLPGSVYLFEKQFQSWKFPVKFHYMCGLCSEALPSNEVDRCPNTLCKSRLSRRMRDDICSFMELPIDLQLISVLQRDHIWEELMRSWDSRVNICQDRGDVCDGVLYQELIMSGFFSSKSNISLLLNTDGIPVFRSSSFSIWPILLLVNELPFSMRIAKHNRLLAGLWYGKTKPDMSLFLKPIAEALSKLYTEGFQIRQQTCRVTLLGCTCDLPARALVMNTVQFNGFYGCSHCLQKGASLTTGKHGRVQVFPFNVDDPCGPTRSITEHEGHVTSAIASGNPVYGVKGPSWFQIIPKFDMFRGMSFDYMHCVLLGVTRLLLRLWFTKAHHNELWYLGRAVEDIDKLLCSIRPPDEIQRTPRSIEHNLKYWKAHELRAWLLHYSPIVLQSFLHEDYFQHHLLLIESIYLLLKDKVTQHDISHSKELLKYYCFMFPDLYEERYLTINIHGLLHLPEVVNNLGPLWAHSCFPFESANGDLLKFFHGSCGVEKQIVQHVNVIQVLATLTNSLTEGSIEKEMFCNLASSKNRIDNRQSQIISDNFSAHGSSHPFVISPEEHAMFLEAHITYTPDEQQAMVYNQVQLKKKRRIIKSSTSKSCRDNSGIVYKDKKGNICFGRFQKLILLDEGTNNDQQLRGIVFLTHLPRSDHKFHTSTSVYKEIRLDEHIVSLNFQGSRTTLIDINSVLDKCILMEIMVESTKVAYASLFPNSKEAE